MALLRQAGFFLRSAFRALAIDPFLGEARIGCGGSVSRSQLGGRSRRQRRLSDESSLSHRLPQWPALCHSPHRRLCQRLRTEAPSLAKSSAVAWPIPETAPVITQTLPFGLKFGR